MPRALVVGAAGGVGQTVTTTLLNRGFDVIGTVLNEAQAERLTHDCPQISGAFPIDLSDADMAREVLSRILTAAEFQPDIVVVSSGISPFGPVETTPLKELRAALEINTLGCVAVYQACMPALRETRGRIIFVSSMAGRFGMPFIGHYAASKFALEGLADVMRQEAFRWGIKVSVIEPGGIRTPLVSDEIEQVRQSIRHLKGDTLAHYGRLYRQFLQRLESNFVNCIEPQIVADAIVSVIDSSDPPARCEIGSDAIRMCSIARTEDPLAIDALFRTAYDGALG